MWVVFVIFACASPEPAVDVATETAALRAVADAYHKAAEAADIDAFAS